MSDPLRDFDHVTSFLGNWGRFQIIVFILLSLSCIPCGYMAVTAVFTSHTPEFCCKTSPHPANSSSSWSGADKCSLHKATGNWTEVPALSNDTEPCLDGWDFNNETHIFTIVTEWDLVCEDAWKVPFSTSIFFFGVLIGCVVAGDLSDRFGRKPVLFFTMALQSVTALGLAGSVNWLMFCILNFFRGLSQISCYTVVFILASETFSKSTMVNFAIMGQGLGYATGYALLPIFAYFIRSWRILLVASAIPSILLIPAWWVIPESSRWLFHKGRVDEAELIIRNAAKWNKIHAPEVIFTTWEGLELMQNKVKDKRTYNYVDLIRTPNIRNITLIGAYLWTALSVVYYGLSLSIGNLNGNIYLNSCFSAVIEIMAYLSMWLLNKRIPGPTLSFCVLMLSGVILLTLQLVPEENMVTLQVLALVGKIGIACDYSFLNIILGELMPTVVRNMGFGIISGAARTGSFLCLYIVYLDVYSKTLPFIIFGTISITAAILSMLLPDARNSKLPDLISEVKPIRGFGCLRKHGSQKANWRLQSHNLQLNLK